MSGLTPYFALRYKCLGDLVNNTDFANFANDVDTALSVIRGLENQVRKPPVVKVVRDTGTQVGIAQNVDTNVSFTTVQWDSSAFANLGVDNTALTIPSDGVYWGDGIVGNWDLFTTITSIRATITVGGAVGPEAKASPFALIGGSLTNAFGPFVATAGQIVRLRVRWTGTGGPAAVGLSQLALYKIC